MSSDNAWGVVCDFDGTISAVDVVDRLLEQYADPSWLAIEAEWKRGEIGSRECLSRQLAILRASRAQIDALADSISIDREFPQFAAFCARHDVPLVIVSDGIDCIITRILRRYDLAHIPVYANSMLTLGEGEHRLLSPHRSADCSSGAGTCKCEIVSDFITGGERRILYVGDGQSDFCVAARLADVVAAKSRLLTHLEAIGRKYVPYSSFADVQRLLGQLLPKRQPLEAVAGDTL